MTLHRPMNATLGELASAAGALENEEQKSSEEQAERWIVALAGQWCGQSLKIPFNPEPTSSWRMGDSALTTGESVVQEVRSGSVSSDVDHPDPLGNSHLVMRIQTGDWGEVALSLDRTNTGLRVLIGVENAAAQAALSPERSTLAAALRAAGMAVESVAVVHGAEFGTVIAPGRSSGVLLASSKAAPTTPEEPEAERKRNSRKLNLTG